MPTKTATAKPIKEMEAGQAFHFTSRKNTANTGHYVRKNSSKPKAINLQTWKEFTFDDTDTGVPVDADLKLK